MKTIVILFVGIIAHVNQSMSFDDTAVLPKLDDHVQQMIVPLDAIANPEDDWVETQCKDEKPCLIPLAGYTVKLEGTRTGFCRKDAIARGVPRLKTIAAKCGGVKGGVRARDVSEIPGSFIDYGSGALTIDSYFEEMLGFEGADGPRTCVACRVRYEGILKGENATFIFKKDDAEVGRLVIKGDHYVTVENSPIPDHKPQGEMDSHFLAYYTLLESCDDPPYPSIKGECTQPNICDLSETDEKAHPDKFLHTPKVALARNESGVRRVPLADCTNSQFP